MATIVENSTACTANDIADAAVRLHSHLLRAHWNGETVAGPDPGIRFNARIGRFIKSYARWLPWSDSIVYAQAQKYWILCNWLMADLSLVDAERCREMNLACTEYLLRAQRPEGYWEYPNREWKGRIATVEGNYASMALLATYQHEPDERYLEGAEKWYRFATENIGFRKSGEGLAINYFGNHGSMMVPNNAASALRVFSWLAKAAGDDQYLEYCGPMVTFLRDVQLDSGELPYGVAWAESGAKDRIHFLCQQYNAFQFLNLADYHSTTGDEEVVPVLSGLAQFICKSLRPNGASRYDCHKATPEVPYYTLASGAALTRATELCIGDYAQPAERAYRRVLSQQCPDGNMRFYSTRNYRLLRDRRSYPRYLSMILYHLLLRVKTLQPAFSANS